MSRGLTRSQFLAAGAGAALTPWVPAHAAPRRRTSARLDVERVEHVVILMQENISFDHYYGTLAGVRGFSDPQALTLPSGRSVFEQPYPASADGYLRPWRFDDASANPCNVLVDNGWASRHNAWAEGRMDGFVGATFGTPNHFTMAYYDRAGVPWHAALADAFTVCDGYFCSVLGPTNPNRLYMWTATIDPNGRDGGPDYDNQAYANGDTRYTWPTYPERLTDAGVSWRVYHEDDDFDDNALKYFASYQDAQPGSPLYENAMRSRPADAFVQDVAADDLPQVSWIVPPTKASEHPMVSAPALGADYCDKVMKAFAAHPKVWRKTALVFTYDEDGGYFDHVRPPTPPPGTPDEFVGDQPIGLGFRVPTVVCSPWTRGGFVCSKTYDHTSLIRFLERRFGVEEPQITAWRRQTCGDLWECFDFASPDYGFPRLPAMADAAARTDAACSNNPVAPPVAVNGPMPSQEPGSKPRRPCARQADPVVIRLPRKRSRRLLSGTVAVSGRRTRRLTRKELRRGRVVLRLPAGTTADVRIVLRVRSHGRAGRVRVERTVRAVCR
ncbi:MAG TPA: alkaline phosphatase family protein [Thermoleophilaceae bacterium]